MNAIARASLPAPSRYIVIIGAGFCGTSVALNLLRYSRSPTQIILVEQGPEFGRGTAYAQRDYPYLLNVPAARMSADSRDPLQFLRFAKRRNPAVTGEDFLPREIYGDYLRSLLLTAERAAPAFVRFTRVTACAQRITQQHNGQHNGDVVVELANGTTLYANDVVIATGNPPPAKLPGAEELQGHVGYFESPWSLPSTYTSWKNVLVVGTGLSMVDAVTNLQSNATSDLSIHAISRRGLMALPQTDFKAMALCGSGERFIAEAHSLRKLVRSVRELVRVVEDAGGDWREVVTAVRNFVPSIWTKLPDGERCRFVRHVQAYWDVHRHRLPPPVADQLEDAQRKRQLHIHAGRIESMQASGDQIAVIWRRRGRSATEKLVVDAVVNATGPDYRVTNARDPLIRSLLNDGLLTADAASLGLRTDEHYALIGSDSQPHAHLFYVGPMLRATYWEATAVAELREHTARLATTLIMRGAQRHNVP